MWTCTPCASGATLATDDDFDLTRIAESGQCFRWEALPDGGYRIPHGAHLIEIRPEGNGRFHLSCPMETFQAVWRPYFDLDTDYRSIRNLILSRADPVLARACREGAGLRLLRQDPWEMLISFVISQNRSIPMIRTSIDALCRLAGRPDRAPDGSVWHRFPAPEAVAALSEASIGVCRLGYRDRYVLRIARDVSTGAFDLGTLEALNDDECLKALQTLYGVGVKVAKCVMLFGLHRMNTFPQDVWMSRVLAHGYPDGYPAERFAPWNGLCQQYLFEWVRRADAPNKKSRT